MKVKDIMSQPAITFQAKDSVAYVLKVMNDRNINGAPIVDHNNELVGMVVKADIYRFLIAPGHYESCPVEWLMTKTVVTAQTDEEVLVIAQRLRDNNIVALPILEDKKVIGVVSLEDITDYFIHKQYL